MSETFCKMKNKILTSLRSRSPYPRISSLSYSCQMNIFLTMPKLTVDLFHENGSVHNNNVHTERTEPMPIIIITGTECTHSPHKFSSVEFLVFDARTRARNFQHFILSMFGRWNDGFVASRYYFVGRTQSICKIMRALIPFSDKNERKTNKAIVIYWWHIKIGFLAIYC